MRRILGVTVFALVLGLGVEPATAAMTHLVSRGVGGVGNSESYQSQVSEDGKVVAFTSLATNLVPSDTNANWDVFVRNLDAAGAETTERVSVSSAGTESNLASHVKAISGNGRFVVFWSSASNLVPNDSNGEADLFVRDRVAKTTERVDVSSDEQQANSGVTLISNVDISADGDRIAFSSGATNLVPGDSNGKQDVFIRRLSGGGTTTRVSLSGAQAQATGNSFDPQISSAGTTVSFTSGAANLAPADNDTDEDIFVRDLGANTTELISVGLGGVGANGASQANAMDASGNLVAFSSTASNLAAGDGNGFVDVFVRDRAAHTTTLVSKTSANKQLTNNALFPRLSADGSTVLFTTTALGVAGNVPANLACVCVYRRGVKNGEPTSAITLSYDDVPLDLYIVGKTMFDVDADASVVTFLTIKPALPIDMNPGGDVYARVTGY